MQLKMLKNTQNAHKKELFVLLYNYGYDKNKTRSKRRVLCVFYKNRLGGFFAFGGNRFIKRTVVDKLFRFIGGFVKLFFQGHGGGF